MLFQSRIVGYHFSFDHDLLITCVLLVLRDILLSASSVSSFALCWSSRDLGPAPKFGRDISLRFIKELSRSSSLGNIGVRLLVEPKVRSSILAEL